MLESFIIYIITTIIVGVITYFYVIKPHQIEFTYKDFVRQLNSTESYSFDLRIMIFLMFIPVFNTILLTVLIPMIIIQIWKKQQNQH